MNTRTFKKVLITKERFSELVENAKAYATEHKLDISEEVAEKYKMKTLRENKKPRDKWYVYKSGT